MATMTVPSSSTRPPVSTFSSNRSTSMYSTTTTVSTASSLVSSHLPLITTTTRNRRPTGGRSTRQYLAQLAQSNIADGTQLAPLRIDVDTNDSTSEDPFYGEGTRGITGTMLSRTDEVARCIQLMQQSCIDNDLSSEVTISSFLNHSFEEICWQAHDSRRAVVVVLLNPSSHQNQSRSAMLRVLQRLRGACQESDWFFPWVAETSSIGGQRGNVYLNGGCYEKSRRKTSKTFKRRIGQQLMKDEERRNVHVQNEVSVLEEKEEASSLLAS
ncbi:hypothetical protein P5673_018058, partial [Acropora cervicornis]